MFEWIVAPFSNLRGIHGWIYGRDGDTELAYGIFTREEIFDIYQPGMNVFVAMAVTGILIGIVFGGMKIGSAGINPANRTFVFAFMKDLAIVAILFFNLSTLYTIVFGINYTIVNAFKADSEGFFEMPTTWDELMELSEISSSNGVIGFLLIGLVLLGLTVWANFYYLMRKISLLILMITGPLMLALYLIPQTKQITMAWFKEFVGTVMVQSVHASLFWMISLITLSGESDFITNTILFIIFIPTSEAIRSLLGMGGGMTTTMSKAGAMMGMGALAGVYGAAKGAFTDKSVMGTLKGAYNGTQKGKDGSADSSDGNDADPEVKKTVGANTGTDIGTTTRAERMLKPGEITNKMGKAVFGAAGSIAGSAMGPGGAIAGSTLGYGVGGAVSGVAGRVGAAGVEGLSALGKKSSGKFADNFKNSFKSKDLADEKLADSLAESKTEKWGEENKEDFMKRNREAFTDADDETLQNMWNQEYSAKKAENLEKAKGYVGAMRKNDGKYANAQSLADQTQESMTEQWAKDNKEQFMQDYDQNNPVPANASKEDKKQHESNKQKAWDKEVTNKQNQFGQLAKNTAEEMSNGLDLNRAYISKEDYANNVANAAHEQDKEAFVKDYRSKFNPDASRDEIEAMYDKKHSGNKQLYMGALQNAKPGEDQPNAKQLADASTEQLTDRWATANKADFERNYKVQNPNSTKEDIDVAWDKEVQGKRQEFAQASNQVANNMSKAQGKDIDQASISKEGFANQVATTLDHNDKQQFVKDYQTNALKTDQDIGKEYDVNHQPEKQSYLVQAQQATKGVKVGKIVSNFGKTANNDYIASQLATVKTAEAKKQFFKDQTDSGIDNDEQISKAWQEKEGQIYAQNHTDVSKKMPTSIELPSRVMPNNVFGDSTMGRAAASGARALVGTATGTYGATLGVVGDGVKGAGNFVMDTKIASSLKGIKVDGSGAYHSAKHQGETSLQALGSGTKGVFKGIQDRFLSHTPKNVLDKQQAVTHGLAYAGGIVTGAGGYQKMAQVGAKHNPYNPAVRQSSEVKEVAEIEQMAQKTDDEFGNKQVSPGAVQMVTTRDQSHLQVKDHAGQTRIVSRYGSGDSGLKKKDVVYQDMTIENGQLSQSSQAFKYDTGGNAVPTNRSVRVNPNRLVANHNRGKTKPIVHEAPPLNQAVDQGSFEQEQVVKRTQNVRMVVTRDTSYMVGTDKNTGEDYRISPYGNGDARLQPNEVRETGYTVKNKRWVKDRLTTNEQKQQVDYHTSTTADDLIPNKENKRAKSRRKMEKMRYKGLGGSV